MPPYDYRSSTCCRRGNCTTRSGDAPHLGTASGRRVQRSSPADLEVDGCCQQRRGLLHDLDEGSELAPQPTVASQLRLARQTLRNVAAKPAGGRNAFG